MACCISFARGHRRSVGVSARNSFGGLTNNYLSEYVHYNISKGYPHNYLSEYVHYKISEGCPHNYLSEYVHKYILEGCPQTNKYLCFENDLSYMESCMCEVIGEDSRYGTGHINIQVGICIILLECVWLPLYEHLCEE